MQREIIKRTLSAKQICALAIIGAIMFTSKVALSAFPNVNLNALIIILTTTYFGWKAIYSVDVYVLLEGLFYGFGLWWLSYLYTWPLLVIITMLIRKNKSTILRATVAGLFGFAFGPLMYIGYFVFSGGWGGFWGMWISGIPYDLTFAVSNFLSVIILYPPLSKVLSIIINTQFAELKN